MFGLYIALILCFAGSDATSFPSCGKCEQGHNQVYCPSSFDLEYEIQLSQEKERDFLEIKCSKETLDFELMAGCSFPTIETVKFSFCAFPAINQSFSNILMNIGINPPKVRDLLFHYATNENSSLTTSHLEGLQNLTSLIFYETQLSAISDDVFSHTPNLKSITLIGNNFQKPLHRAIFSGLVDLESLNLNNNEIAYLHEDTFQDLRNLQQLAIISNKITEVPQNLFYNLKSLQTLRLSSNEIETLHEDTFSNNSNITEIFLNKNLLEELPQKLFWNCPNLTKISLSGNKLRTVPVLNFENNTNFKVLLLSRNNLLSVSETFLKGMISLTELDLSYNNLTTLPDNLFNMTANLTVVKLQGNLFEQLPKNIFQKSVNLQEIYLNNNNLTTLPSFSTCGLVQRLHLQKNRLPSLSFLDFPVKNKFDNPALTYVDLSFNQLDENSILTYGVFALNHQLNLEVIDLSHNRFKMSPVVGSTFTVFVNLTEIDLSGNEIAYVNLVEDVAGLPKGVLLNFKSNLIKSVKVPEKFERSIKVYLSDNKLNCDCNLYNLAKLLRSSAVEQNDNGLKVHDWHNLVCNSPQEFVNMTIYSMSFSNFICRMPADSRCSLSCPCSFRSMDKMVTVECSNRTLDAMVQYKNLPNWNYSLDLSHNNFTDRALENVTVFPQSLRFVDLRFNQLTYLPEKFVNTLNTSSVVISLEGNPWRCDCKLQYMIKFIQASYFKVKSLAKLKCSDSDKLVYELTIEGVCPFYVNPSFIAGAVAFVVIILIITVLMTILFYRYKVAIKVWLFKHRLFLWFIVEEELDANKKYDAFISYSHKDEEFVMESLVPGLEDGDPKYKLCIHHRDWVPGEVIQEQILKSVADSRRTIVILSVDFIDSVWGQMEFRVAHKKALEENTTRVIVIVHGRMPDRMNPELKHYIKLHTYLKSDNPKFWDQLRFAMPHPKDLLRQRKKRARHIDKIELVNGHSKQSLDV